MWVFIISNHHFVVIDTLGNVYKIDELSYNKISPPFRLQVMHSSNAQPLFFPQSFLVCLCAIDSTVYMIRLWPIVCVCTQFLCDCNWCLWYYNYCFCCYVVTHIKKLTRCITFNERVVCSPANFVYVHICVIVIVSCDDYLLTLNFYFYCVGVWF